MVASAAQQQTTCGTSRPSYEQENSEGASSQEASRRSLLRVPVCSLELADTTTRNKMEGHALTIQYLLHKKK